MSHRKHRLGIIATVLVLSSGAAFGQPAPWPAPNTPQASTPWPAPGSAPAPEQASAPAAAPPSSVPDNIRLNLLIHNAIIALNQANATGNYSVLRDMGTPAFQLANSAARLAEIFSALRARNLDLSPVFFTNPRLAAPPSVLEGQVIRVNGMFPTAPEQIHFDLAFQPSGDRWLIAGIAVNMNAPADQPNLQPPAAPQPPRVSDAGASASKPGEARPVRIDLNQATPAPGSPDSAGAVKKAPTPPKKPKPKPASVAAPQASSSGDAPRPAEAKEETKSTDGGSNWNPFH